MCIRDRYYPEYKERFGEDSSVIEKRLIKILGIILGGLANFNTQVKQETFLVIGQYIFGSKILTLKQKHKVFSLIYKKLLTLISEKELSELFFFNNSASFNHIYRFISDYELSLIHIYYFKICANEQYRQSSEI